MKLRIYELRRWGKNRVAYGGQVGGFLDREFVRRVKISYERSVGTEIFHALRDIRYNQCSSLLFLTNAEKLVRHSRLGHPLINLKLVESLKMPEQTVLSM